MPRIQISQPHHISIPEVRICIDRLNADLGAKYELKSSWVSPQEATVVRNGVKGTIRIESTEVIVDLDLSIMLSPLKGTIETKIREELKKMLA